MRLSIFLLFIKLIYVANAKSWAQIVSDTPQKEKQAIKDTAAATETCSPPPLHAVYKRLPKGVTKHLVRNVYDGDTLTLMDERRVRFTGIDAPEVKERQPFAQESKAYVKSYCRKKQEIYLDIHGEDKYGRLLADVWSETEDGHYVNVNEGVVSAGLASVYLASKDDKPKNLQKLLDLQKQARERGLGIWMDFEDRNVVATAYGTAFHEPICRHLAHSRNTRILKMSKAMDQGLHPCRTCMA